MSIVDRRSPSSSRWSAPRSRERFAVRDREAARLLRELSISRDPVERERLVEQIVVLHLGLCDAIAARYAARGIPLDDLTQVARVGLLLAIARYEPGDDRSFVGYAMPTISGEVKRHFRDHGWMVRPTRRLQELGPIVRDARQQWQQEHQADPGIQDLAEVLGLTVSIVGECLSLTQSYHLISLDLSLGDLHADSLIDTLTIPDRELEAVPERVVLSAAVRRLTAADQQLLRMRFVDDFTQRQIADGLGISQMQVSRRLKLALGQVRALMVTADGYVPEAPHDVDQGTTRIGARSADDGLRRHGGDGYIVPGLGMSKDNTLRES